jgi:dUTP pyrophosphatase
MNKKIIFEKTSTNAVLPTRANSTDSGMDFYSPIDIDIPSLSDVLIPLDLKVQIPRGMDLVVHNKSGRSTKNKVIKGAEVIDEGYRGVIHVHLFNLGKETVHIKAGEKIAQGIVRKVEYPQIVEGKVNENTSRGTGGFGSSGIK